MVPDIRPLTFDRDIHEVLNLLDRLQSEASTSNHRASIRAAVLDLRSADFLTPDQARWVLRQREARGHRGPIEVSVNGFTRDDLLDTVYGVGAPVGTIESAAARTARRLRRAVAEQFLGLVTPDGQQAFAIFGVGWRVYPSRDRRGQRLDSPELLGPQGLARVGQSPTSDEHTAPDREMGVFRLWADSEFVAESRWPSAESRISLAVRPEDAPPVRELDLLPFPEAVPAGSAVMVIGLPGRAVSGPIVERLLEMVTDSYGEDAFVSAGQGQSPAVHLVVHGRISHWPAGMAGLSTGLPGHVAWQDAAEIGAEVAGRWASVAEVLDAVARMFDSSAQRHSTLVRWQQAADALAPRIRPARAAAAGAAGPPEPGSRAQQASGTVLLGSPAERAAAARRRAMAAFAQAPSQRPATQAREFSQRRAEVLALGKALTRWRDEHVRTGGSSVTSTRVPAAAVIPGLYGALAGYLEAGDWLERALVDALPEFPRLPLDSAVSGWISMRAWIRPGLVFWSPNRPRRAYLTLTAPMQPDGFEAGFGAVALSSRPPAVAARSESSRHVYTVMVAPGAAINLSLTMTEALAESTVDVGDVEAARGLGRDLLLRREDLGRAHIVLQPATRGRAAPPRSLWDARCPTCTGRASSCGRDQCPARRRSRTKRPQTGRSIWSSIWPCRHRRHPRRRGWVRARSTRCRT